MLIPQPCAVGGNRVARIPFVRHRTVNQIRAKYRACRHPIERTRWHALWLLARTDEPRTPAQVAAVVGLSDVTVRDTPSPVERPRPGRAGRPPPGQRGRPEAECPPAGRPVRRPPEAAPGRRAVEWPEGGTV